MIPSLDNLLVVSAVLAGHAELSERHDPDPAETLRRAPVEPLPEDARASTAAALDAADDPFTLMVHICKQREVNAFGDGFVFHHPVDDEREYVADVRRCFFHDVLTANDAAHLTPVLCAWDSNWLDAVNVRRHGFHADRRTSIGLGSTSCPFRFRRTSDSE